MRGGPGTGLLFYFPPLWSSSLSRIQQKREGERGGRNVPLNFSWMIFVRGEGTSVFMKGPGRGHSEGKMWLSGPGHPRKCAMPHSSGKIQPVLQYFKITFKKRTLPLPSVLSAWGCLLCTCETAVIPRGFGSEAQWVWMLSTLKIKPFLPQNDEKPMTAPLVHVSEKGCWVARQVHVPLHMGLIITWGHPWVPPETVRSFPFFFFLLGFPHLPQRHLGLTRAGKVKQGRTEGLILLEVLNSVLDRPFRAILGTIFETRSQPLSRLAGAVRLFPYVWGKGCEPLSSVNGEFYFTISLLCHDQRCPWGILYQQNNSESLNLQFITAGQHFLSHGGGHVE